MGDCLRTDKPSRYVNCNKPPTQFSLPSLRVGKSSLLSLIAKWLNQTPTCKNWLILLFQTNWHSKIPAGATWEHRPTIFDRGAIAPIAPWSRRLWVCGHLAKCTELYFVGELWHCALVYYYESLIEAVALSTVAWSTKLLSYLLSHGWRFAVMWSMDTGVVMALAVRSSGLVTGSCVEWLVSGGRMRLRDISLWTRETIFRTLLPVYGCMSWYYNILCYCYCHWHCLFVWFWLSYDEY